MCMYTNQSGLLWAPLFFRVSEKHTRCEADWQTATMQSKSHGYLKASEAMGTERRMIHPWIHPYILECVFLGLLLLKCFMLLGYPKLQQPWET